MTNQAVIFQSEKYLVTMESGHGDNYRVRRLTDGQSVSFSIEYARGMLNELSDKDLDFWGAEDCWFM